MGVEAGKFGVRTNLTTPEQSSGNVDYIASAPELNSWVMSLSDSFALFEGLVPCAVL